MEHVIIGMCHQWGILRKVRGNHQEALEGFPGGSAVKNSPASAGDMGSIPGPGRFHMSGSDLAHEPQLLSSRAPATEASTS